MKYRTKPVIYEAVQFKGTPESCDEVTKFFGGEHRGDNHQWRGNTLRGGWIKDFDSGQAFYPSDWIVRKGVDDFDVYTDTAFEENFELVE